jgi:hypothetical protein
MASDTTALSSAITVQPGEESRVFRGDGSGPARSGDALALIATQDESPDDGGSQSPLGVLVVGLPGAGVRVEFDVRDGTVVTVPSAPFEIFVRNVNAPGDPAVTVSSFPLQNAIKAPNTRTLDIGFAMEDPNIRVPAFAHSFVFDHGLPEHGEYRALLSDSATGETYGMAAPLTQCSLNQRSRFVRFVDLPEGSGGTVTFFLSL